MEPSPATRILVVANQTAATARLQAEVRRRAERGPCAFTLLIPDASDRTAAKWVSETAAPLLARAAGSPVDRRIGGHDPFESVKAAVADGDYGDYGDFIISTLPKRMSKWLRRDLVRQVENLGVPVTAITPPRPKQERDYAVGYVGGGPA